MAQGVIDSSKVLSDTLSTLCPRKDQVLPFDDDSPVRMSRGRSLLDFLVWLEQWAALAIGHCLRWSNLVVDFPDDVSGIP